MKPLSASPALLPGLPMTSLLRSTPAAAISKRAEPGQSPPAVFSRLLQVVYSVVPSETSRYQCIRSDARTVHEAYDCRTKDVTSLVQPKTRHP